MDHTSGSNTKSDLRIVTCNLHGYKNSRDFLRQLIASYDIIFVQELWLHDCELTLLNTLSDDFVVYSQSGISKSVELGILRGRPYGVVLFNQNHALRLCWVLTELLPHPVYAWKQMSPLSVLGGKTFTPVLPKIKL